MRTNLIIISMVYLVVSFYLTGIVGANNRLRYKVAKKFVKYAYIFAMAVEILFI